LTDTWTALPDMPDGVYDSRAEYWNGKLYVFGGGDTGGAIRNYTRIYDIAGNIWSYSASMPGPRYHHISAIYAGKIYIIGGLSVFNGGFSSQVWEYDPATNTWYTGRANVPTTLAGAPAIAINGHIYTFGGRTTSSTHPTRSTTTTSPPTPGPRASLYPRRAGRRPRCSTGACGLWEARSPVANSTSPRFDLATNSWSSGPNQRRPLVGWRCGLSRNDRERRRNTNSGTRNTTERLNDPCALRLPRPRRRLRRLHRRTRRRRLIL
jgi:hypothetical protein